MWLRMHVLAPWPDDKSTRAWFSFLGETGVLMPRPLMCYCFGLISVDISTVSMGIRAPGQWCEGIGPEGNCTATPGVQGVRPSHFDLVLLGSITVSLTGARRIDSCPRRRCEFRSASTPSAVSEETIACIMSLYS